MKIPFAILFLLVFSAGVFAQQRDSVRLQLLIRQSRSDSARGDFLSAIKHMNEYQAIKNTLLETVKKQQAVQLEKQFQTVKKDLEIKSQEKNIALLSNQNRLTDRYLNQTHVIRTIIITVGLAVALLLAACLWLYRQKIATNQHLQIQQKTIAERNHHLEDLAAVKDDLLEQKELLIKEIHHRVKNNLQVVISLLNTQSAYLNDPQTATAIRQSQRRMQAISLIHQKLYQSESRAVINIGDYVNDLVYYIRQSFNTGSRIVFHVNIAGIELDVLYAVPLGLILNETITNSLTYAFKPEQRGDISIDLDDVGSGLLSLTVSDNGCGLPEKFTLEKCESLGINLVKNMCREIGGTLTIEQDFGLKVMIEAPLLNDGISSFGDNEISSHAVNLM